MPGQKAGLWYVQGEWSIVKTGATYADTKERHNPATIAGKCQTELDFNPTAENIDWTARASLPMSPIAGQWGRGEGSLTVNKNATGDLFLKLELWPVQP
jgi:hypothetical protein